jgi:hypothetical protein
MHPQSLKTQLTIVASFVVLTALSLWLMVAPTMMTFSTYAAVTSLVIGVAVVTLNASHNARPTGSLGQLLYETEQDGSADIFQRRRR